MNDRDFKLLVREYFQAKSLSFNGKYLPIRAAADIQVNNLEKRILSELERFSKQEQEELPFKD